MMATIETPRFLLRAFEASDFADLHEYAQDLEVARYQSWGPNDETATREFIRRCSESFDMATGDDIEFAIVDRETSQVLGGCGTHSRRTNCREFEIG